MSRDEQGKIKDLARAIVGNAIAYPESVFRELDKIFMIDALPIQERELYQAVRDVFENNGHKDVQIGPGDVLAQYPDLDPSIYAACIDQATSTSAAIKQARELTRIYRTSEIRKAAGRITRAKNDEDLAAETENFRQLLDEPDIAAGTDLQWRTASTLGTEVQSRPAWVAEPLVARGAITECDGKVKCGKTRFFLDLVGSVIRGETFLGGQTESCPVVYLTEERAPTFRSALNRADLLNAKNLHILLRQETRSMSWSQIVQRVISFTKEVEAGLLVVDTLFDWAGLKGEEENDAGAALNAMRPLQAAAAEGLGVLVGRHDRKSGGEIGDSGRGSSAFAGVADVLLVLRRANTEGHPTRRLLLGVGRFDDVPEHLILELRDDHYVSLGDALNLERQEAKKILRDILPGPEGTPLLEAELRERMGDDVSRSTLKRALEELMEAGQVKREKGYGKNKQAYGYWLVNEVSSYREDPEQVNSICSQNHVSKEDVSSPHTPEQLNIDNELSSPPPITEQLISEKEEEDDNLPF